jgi:hypothetical protein
MASVFARGREVEPRVDTAGRHVPRFFQPGAVVKDEARGCRQVAIRAIRAVEPRIGAGRFDE